jgi:hexosaminidase
VNQACNISDMPFDPLLLPPPRDIHRTQDSWEPSRQVGVYLQGAISGRTPALERVQRALASLEAELSIVEDRSLAEIRLLPEESLAAEAYSLRVDPSGVVLRAATAAGFDHGLSTLAQWLRAVDWSREDDSVPGVQINDAPDLPERGVSIDVARDKRPTLATLFELIERLASWKLNRLQLYMEADFAYSFAGQVLANRSPYTAQEIGELDAFCRARHVELVPNQQSFGHLHAWMRHEPWRELAEVPEGVEHPFSRTPEPFSLAACDPKALAFLDRLYGELLPCFSSTTINVGLDETFDLGEGRSAAACSSRGKHRVYLEHLLAVHQLAATHGRRVQFWGDIVLEKPEVIADLPSDATAMVWGYEADFPFEQRLPAFAESGLSFHVCPGTSAWNSFGGRVTNALGNLKAAAVQARAHGAQGVLVTDWGDRGHLQPLPTTFLGYLCGAAFSWNVDSTGEIDMERARRLLDRHAFEDRAGIMGRTWIELGRVTDLLEDDCENGHALFFATTFADSPFPHPRVVGLTRTGLDAARAHLEAVLQELPDARSDRPDADILTAEAQLARDMLALAESLARERIELPVGHGLAELPPHARERLRRDLDRLRDHHSALWVSRNRPGGLAESLRWLDFLGDC